MSADCGKAVLRFRLALICGLLGGPTVAADEAPKLEFLEYLASWEESDEDWLLFSDVETAEANGSEERSDPAPAGKESAETDDES